MAHSLKEKKKNQNKVLSVAPWTVKVTLLVRAGGRDIRPQRLREKLGFCLCLPLTQRWGRVEKGASWGLLASRQPSECVTRESSGE